MIINKKDKISLSRILDNIYSNNDSVRARYYKYYATEEERRIMDREDRISSIVARIIAIILLLLIAFIL